MSISGLKLRRFSLKISIKYLIFALYPILSIYIFLPGITYGNLILVIYLVFRLLVSKKIKLDSSFFIMMTIFICSNLLQLIINRNVNAALVIHNTFSMILFLLVTISLTMDSTENLWSVYKYLKIISFACSLGLLYQFINWTLFNEKVTLFIPGIRLIAYQFLGGAKYRPCSFFTEPSHLAIYLLPVFALSLIKKDYYYSVFLLITLFFSTSSLGILVAIIILLWNFKNILLKRISSEKILVIGLTTASIILFLIFFESDITTFALNKLLTIFGKNSSPRLLGSLNYIGFFGLPQYLFGIGLNQFSYLVNLKLGLDVPNYSNSLVFSFISFGIIGFIVWILYLYTVIRKIPREYISIGIIFVSVCATDQVMFNQNLLYMLVLLSIISKTKEFPVTVSE